MRIPSLSQLPFRLNTLKRLKHDEEFQRVKIGKYKIPYQFIPCGRKTAGSATGNLYFKRHTNPKTRLIEKVNMNRIDAEMVNPPLKKWLGKIGMRISKEGVCGSSCSQDSVIRDEREMNFSMTLEFIGNSLYRLLSDASFETAKMRLCRLPLMNEFLKDDILVQMMMEELEVEECLRIMCKWSNEYRDIGKLKVNFRRDIVPFMSVITSHGIVPEKVIDPEDSSREVDLEGFMGVLACSTALGDIDSIGVSGKNIGYVIERNEKSGRVDRIRIVKIDPGMCFSFKKMRDNGLKNKKDIIFCSNYDDRGIIWSKLKTQQKYEFLEVKIHHMDVIKDRRILEYLFFRDKKLNFDKYEKVSRKICDKLIDELIENIRTEDRIYRSDFLKYRRERTKVLDHLSVEYEEHGDMDRYLLCLEKLLVLYSGIDEEIQRVLNNMGVEYNRRRDSKKALECLEKSLNIRKRIYNSYDRSIAQSYSNLSLVYVDENKVDKAIEYLEKSLKIQKKTLSANDLSLAHTFHNLGGVYNTKGLNDRSIENYEQALKIKAVTLPPNHLEFAETYGNLGVLYSESEQYGKAIENLEKCLRIREKKLPSNHRSLGSTYHNLASVYKNKEENRKAIEMFQKSMNILKKTLSPYHPDLATSYGMLGDVHSAVGELEKALDYNLKGLEIRKKSLPPGHLDFSTSYNSLGSLYFKMGDYDKAIKYFKMELNILKTSLPQYHRDFALPYGWLGSCYYKKEEYDKSIENYKMEQTVREKGIPSFVKNDPKIPVNYQNLGTSFYGKGDNESAIRLYLKALEILKKTVSRKDPAIIGLNRALSIVYEVKFDFRESIRYCEKNLRIYADCFPENYPDTASCYSRLGSLYEGILWYPQAIRCYSDAYDIYVANFGKENSEAVEMAENVERVKKKRENFRN